MYRKIDGRIDSIISVMPFTPFHFGPALFFGLLLFRYIHFPTFLIANVIVDIEPFLILFFNSGHSLHGFFHSFAGGSIAAVILALLMVKMDKYLQNLLVTLKLSQDFSSKSIWMASFSGIFLHILFDSPLYRDIKPFYPSDFNPFFNTGFFTGFDIYFLCILLFVAGVVIYGYKYKDKLHAEKKSF